MLPEVSWHPRECAAQSSRCARRRHDRPGTMRICRRANEMKSTTFDAARRSRLIALLTTLALAPTLAIAAPPAWKLAVIPAPTIRPNYPTDMRVRITDAKGQPVTGASVEYVVTMIDMDHGEHKSAAKMIEPGLYEG